MSSDKKRVQEVEPEGEFIVCQWLTRQGSEGEFHMHVFLTNRPIACSDYLQKETQS